MYTYKNLFNAELEYTNNENNGFGFTESSIRYYYHAAVRAAKRHDSYMFECLQGAFLILRALWEYDIITIKTYEETEKLRTLIIKIYDRSFTPW